MVTIPILLPAYPDPVCGEKMTKTMTKTGHVAFSSGQFPGAANRLPFCKLLFYNMIGFSAHRTGLPDAHLHMAIHGFAFWKFAKPAHEHHLASFSNPFSSLLLYLNDNAVPTLLHLTRTV
jgi:hypothetical protein